MINFKIFIVLRCPFVVDLKIYYYNKMCKEHACPRFNLGKYFTNFNETRRYTPLCLSLYRKKILRPFLHIFETREMLIFTCVCLLYRQWVLNGLKKIIRTRQTIVENEPHFGSFVCKRESPWSHSWNAPKTCLTLTVAIVCLLTHLYIRVMCYHCRRLRDLVVIHRSCRV